MSVRQPLIIAISLASQRVTVFEGDAAIAHAPVSTGRAGHPTPKGVFSVIQKKRFHRSNIYSSAPMPFMQRITWSGIALHGGVLPGYPASHGCIRMPQDFASMLFGMTKVGARVVITQHDVMPIQFEHSRLAMLEKGDVSHTGELRPAITKGVRAAEASGVARLHATDATGAPPAASSVTINTTDRSSQAVSGLASATVGSDQASVPPIPSDVSPSEIKGANPPAKLPPAAAVNPQDGEQRPAGPTQQDLPVIAAMAIEEVFVPPSRPARPLRSAPVSVFISRKEGKLFIRKGFDPLFSARVLIAEPDQPIGTHVFTATEVAPDGTSLRWVALTVPDDVPAAAKPHAHTGAGRGKDNKVATARAAAHDTALSSAPTAGEALDRIDLSGEITAQISDLMSVGASVIISDQALGSETGLETDFIVLTPSVRSRAAAKSGGRVGAAPGKARTNVIRFWQ